MDLKDNIEFEAKFYPVNKDEYRNLLKNKGAILKVSERKMLRIVGDHSGNVNIPPQDYIRVRDEGNLIRLSYKTMAKEDGNVTDQKEIDVEVSDFEKTVKILELAGIDFNKKQESLREEWEYKGAEITIDTWPGLPSYSEIEAESEENVKEIAEELGFDWNKKIITAAPEVFSKVYGISVKEASDKLKFVTFENNPFAGMAKVWDPKTQPEG